MNTQVPQAHEVHQPNGRSRLSADRTLSHGEPARPLLGFLPIKRLIPMDVHSMMDYVNGLAAGSGYYFAKDNAACNASLGLAASVIGLSLFTDYRLSVAKVIPIRTHEAMDHVWGISAIAAPFVFGYWKKSPRVAMMHVIAGAGTILASMFTDYRSYKKERQRARAGGIEHAPAV
jgi:hypothetical protein